MAGRFPDAWLDDLRSRVGIEEVVSEYVSLRQKGKRYWGLCPFHNEKTPSFSVDAETGFFYCFGCHKGGTVINFVMEMERLEFTEAVTALAERAHLALPDYKPDARVAADAEARDRIYEANVFAARYFNSLLWEGEGAEVLGYLYSRGLNDSDIRRFGLGASPRDWDTLYRALTDNGFSHADILRAGLASEKDGRAHDMFRYRAMFPIISAQGKVLGFGGRAMGDAQPKYLNTAETPVFNKRNGLYALNMAKNERGAGHLVLVEGYMDTVSLRKYGVKGVVATLGTALTEEQARLMKRYAGEVWISYDGDNAGRKAALRALDILDAANLATKVIDYPGGMDPDDFIRARGLEGFEALRKLDGCSYRLLRAKDELDMNSQDGITQYTIRACAILKKLQSPVDLENRVRSLANETGYDREILMRQIGATQGAGAETKLRRTPEKRVSRRSSPSECALIALMASGVLPSSAIVPDDFDSPVNARAALWIAEGRPLAGFLDGLTGEEREGIMTAINSVIIPEDPADALDMARGAMREMHAGRIKARIAEIQAEIAAADAERKRELYGQLMELQKELSV